VDTLEGMRVFAQVVESGSFSAAAERLGLSKALASKYVSQLEQRLGARLLNRTTRRLSLTEAGETYYRGARGLLAEVTALEEGVRQQQTVPRGHLRIAAPRVFGEESLIGAIERFRRRYPEITLDLALEERTVDIVQEGFDLAIRIGILAESSLIARRIGSYRYVLCAAPAYLKRAGTPALPSDLTRHATIVNAAIAPTDQWDFRVEERIARVTVRPFLRINAARPVRQLVLAGEGIGLCLYPTVAEDIAAGRLIRLLEPYEAYNRDLSVVYPHARHLPAKVRLFIDHLVGAFAT